jgi:hypothetical protein
MFIFITAVVIYSSAAAKSYFSLKLNYVLDSLNLSGFSHKSFKIFTEEKKVFTVSMYLSHF